MDGGTAVRCFADDGGVAKHMVQKGSSAAPRSLPRRCRQRPQILKDADVDLKATTLSGIDSIREFTGMTPKSFDKVLEFERRRNPTQNCGCHCKRIVLTGS
ncbi:unnamed protein product [Symbiodinium sp. CCMP2592]|nr:unnamed protein product [Symbiodinium sp. CCMP2592]